jgi:hypothetical protein
VSILDRILTATNNGFAALATQRDLDSARLDQILAILNEPDPIAGADIHFEENMSKLHHSSKGKLKFVLNDNGTATGTISFVDAAGAATTPAAGATIATTVTSSDPGVTASVDATGLIVSVAPASPLPSPLPLGVVISASVTITNTDGTVLGPFPCDDSKDPLNVTAGGPAGATITFA